MRRALRTIAGVLSLLTMWFAGALTGSVQAQTTLVVPQEQVLFMPVQGNAFNVIQVLSVKNNSNAAQNVEIAIPAGATKLAVQGDTHTASHVHGQNVVLPNWAKPSTTTAVTLTYTLPFNSQTGVQFTLHSVYPVYTARLFLPIGDSALSAPGIMPNTQTVTISGTSFRVFTRPGIQAGDNWPMSVTLLPSTTSPDAVKGLPSIGMDNSSAGNTLQALGNLLVAALVLVIGLISIRSTQWGKSARKPVSQEEALYHAWETTEQQYRQGVLDKEEFEARRERFKGKLVELKTAGDKG